MNNNNSASEAKNNKEQKAVPVVAIGGSAGALEAMKDLLKHLSPDTGMAYVYIQHLSPDFESNLTAILGRVTKMEVQEARHRLPVQPNKVYIIPTDQDMSIDDGHLILNQRTSPPAIHMPIDQFFSSLAERQKEASIGILLSGMSNDGTLGLKAIRAASGVTIVQDDTAAYQSMPKSAIAHNVVDLVLPPESIATELERFGKKIELMESIAVERQEEEISTADEELKSIIQILKKSVGVDFTHYKMNTFKRRIIRRMLLHKQETLTDYLRYLRQNAAEVDQLYQDLLINVTTFFRDPESIAFLKEAILPRILDGRSPNNPVRIWVPACATGEEAYSLAIIIVDLLGDQATNIPIQIFATDLSELAISKARVGVYTQNELSTVPPQYMQRFFTKIDGAYRVAKHIRDLCVFAPHNVFKDPPFYRLDMVSCCNLMIYLDQVLQKKVLTTFHYALNKGCYLVLGKSESIGAAPQFFSQVEKKHKVYTKKEVAQRGFFEMQYRHPEIDRTDRTESHKPVKKEIGHLNELEKTVDDILLSRYVPACVVVNEDLEIQQFKGSTGLYLEPAPGKASLNLLKMAKAGLTFDLRNIIHKAARSSEVVKKKGIEVKWGDKVQYINIEVVPLRTLTEEKHFMVIFEQTPAPGTTDTKSSASKDAQVKKLQEELMTVKEDMQAIIEEQQSSNEELQSANEEIVSANEELQSINEELETSKEELESANEELMTINAELQMRNEQLAEAYDYAEALFDTVRKSVLLLDKDLRVKTANQAFYHAFQLREDETEGILIYELDNRHWDIPQLRQMLEDLLRNNAPVHGLEINYQFHKIGERTIVFNAAKVTQKVNRQQVIILTIDDVTEQRQVQKKMNEKDALLQAIGENMTVMLWANGTDKKRHFFNKQWLDFTGRPLEEELNDGWLNTLHKEDLNRYLKTFNTSFEERKPYTTEYRLLDKNGAYQLIKEEGRPVFTAEAIFSGFTGSCSPVT